MQFRLGQMSKPFPTSVAVAVVVVVIAEAQCARNPPNPLTAQTPPTPLSSSALSLSSPPFLVRWGAQAEWAHEAAEAEAAATWSLGLGRQI